MNNFNNGYPAGNMYPNNMGGYAPSGYVQQPIPVQKSKNVLTNEEIKSIRQNGDSFSLGLTADESLRGICFHKDENGVETLRDNGDGTVTCTICGHRFDPLQNCTQEDIQMYVDNITDVLQTIKLLYIDMPTEAAREYFQIIPLIQKIPKLFKIASDNFNRHENYNGYRYNGAPNTINLYQMLSSGAISPGFAQQGYMPNGYAQQPYQAYPQQGYGAPIQQPYQQMQANPFGGYGTAPMQPQGGYQPTTTGFGYTPNQTSLNNAPVGTLPQIPNNANVAYTQQQPLAAPTPTTVQTVDAPAGTQAPAATTATTDGKEVKVNSSFKS